VISSNTCKSYVFSYLFKTFGYDQTLRDRELRQNRTSNLTKRSRDRTGQTEAENDIQKKERERRKRGNTRKEREGVVMS